MLIGVAGRIEIWSKDKYEEASAVDDMEAIAEKMSDLGIYIRGFEWNLVTIR